jgi:hypothetical protein
LLFGLLIHHVGAPPPLWRQAAACFVVTAALAFVLTVERATWIYSLLYALYLAAGLSLIGWWAAYCNLDKTLFEWPFISGPLAGFLSVPLFQTFRDAGRWEVPPPRPDRSRWRQLLSWAGGPLGLPAAMLLPGAFFFFFIDHTDSPPTLYLSNLGLLFVFALMSAVYQRQDGEIRKVVLPYGRLHWRVCDDALIVILGVAAVLIFAVLVSSAGIRPSVSGEPWFTALTGLAFGTSVGFLRDRNDLLAALERLMRSMLTGLTPVLAAAVLAFLISMPRGGFTVLRNNGLPVAPTLLGAVFLIFLVVNAIIGGSRDHRSKNRALIWSAVLLAAVALPLAAAAAISIKLRIDQYGWTPTRIWGVIGTVAVSIYGIGAWCAIAKGRLQFDEALRPFQRKFAFATCAFAGVLAVPGPIDFGAKSAFSQMDRFRDGQVADSEFNWAGMASDYGYFGRELLKDIILGNSTRSQEALALAALKSVDPNDPDVRKFEAGNDLGGYTRLVPTGFPETRNLDRAISDAWACGRWDTCLIVQLAPDRVAALDQKKGTVFAQTLLLRGEEWRLADGSSQALNITMNLEKAAVEIRRVGPGRQLYVEGRPFGRPFRDVRPSS